MRPTTVAVDLGDDDPVDAPDPQRVPPRRRRRRWLVVGCAAAVLALVVGQWAADARAQASWERLSDRTEVVAPAARPVSQRWSLDPSTLATVSLGVAWRGTVVGPALAADGSIGITQLDDRDGHRRWTTPVIGPDPSRSAGRGVDRARSSCRRVPDDATRVVCLVTDSVVTISAPTDSNDVTGRSTSTSRPSEVHLVVVDPRSGRVLADHRLTTVAEQSASSSSADQRVIAMDPSSGEVRWDRTVVTGTSTLDAVLPGGLAVVVSSDAGRIETVGVDSDSGNERWRTETAASPSGVGDGVVRVGDLAAAIDGAGLHLLAADGTVRRSVALPNRAGAMPLSDGRLLVPQEAGTLVVGPDHDVHLDGTPVGIASDDGSLPGLTLVSQGALRAYDEDGRQRWQLQGSSPSNVLVLHGVVYLTRDGEVTAVEGSTGTVRWHTSLPVQLLSPITDGRVLLVALSAEVAALDLRTGSVLWRAPLPPGHTTLEATRGLLLAYTQDGSDTAVLG